MNMQKYMDGRGVNSSIYGEKKAPKTADGKRNPRSLVPSK
jgi:hypothetical protein